MQKIILIASVKGGVGKSTIANILCNKLENSVILNLDPYQDAEDFNSARTINILPHTNLPNIIEKLDEDFIILDARSFLDERLRTLDIDLFVFMTRVGYRSLKTTADSAVSLCMYNWAKSVLFLVNEVRNQKEIDIAGGMLSQMLEDLNSENISFTSFAYSGAIKTLENRKVSISDLLAEGGLFRKTYAPIETASLKLKNEILELLR
jgi:CO dehydrogenase nickel-insertion accessory protein CooC1